MTNHGPGTDHRQHWAKLETEKPKVPVLRRVVGWTALLGLVGFVAIVFAVPACACSTRVPAYFAAMSSDLKNLASQQEIYFSDTNSYSTVVRDLAFTNSYGVLVRIEATDNGWTAAAAHVGLDYEKGCAMYYGEVEWPMYTPEGRRPEAPGELVCDPRD